MTVKPTTQKAPSTKLRLKCFVQIGRNRPNLKTASANRLARLLSTLPIKLKAIRRFDGFQLLKFTNPEILDLFTDGLKNAIFNRMLPPKILIIDDDSAINRLVGDFLRQYGYTVVCATDGKQGLALATTERPDLILCDIDMPALDGLGVISKLRQDPIINAIPVIFLSGCSDRRQVRQSMDLGGDDFLSKPVQLKEILDAVKARIHRHQQQSQRTAQRLRKAVEIFSGIVDDLDKRGDITQWIAQANRSTGNGSRLAPPPLHPEAHLSTGVDLAPNATGAPAASFLANTGNCRQFVKLSDVKVFMACGEYSKAFWGKDQSMMFRKPMKQWQKELPEHQFVRVHRSAIINLSFLSHVQKEADQSQVHLREFSNIIPISLRCLPELNRRLKQYATTLK